MKKISIPEESYWKLVELKARLRCKTWRELIDAIYENKESIETTISRGRRRL